MVDLLHWLEFGGANLGTGDADREGHKNCDYGSAAALTHPHELSAFPNLGYWVTVRKPKE